MPSYPALNDRFSTCEAFLVAVNSATFSLDDWGITVQAEHTSRKTAHGKKITVRCKLGRRKTGRKASKAGSRNGDDDVCPFRLVAERDDLSTSTGLGDFVVTECQSHTTSLHAQHLYVDADVNAGLAASGGTSSEAAPIRDGKGKFVARARPPASTKEVSAGQPVFAPEEPTVIDDVLYLRSGFAIPFLPSKRDSTRNAERIRPKRRSQSNLSHTQDARWYTWEARALGEGERPVKRQRIRGAGGEDALRAWGWIHGLDDEDIEAEEPERLDGGDEEGASAECEQVQRDEAVEDVVDGSTPRSIAKAQLHERGSSSQRETAPLHDFWSRPDVIHIGWADLPTKANQQPPEAPFPTRFHALPQSHNVDDLSEAMSKSFSLDLSLETPETSFSPTSPTLQRRREEHTVKSDLPPTYVAVGAQRPPSSLETIKREEVEHAREQLALEALLGLSGLAVQLQSEPTVGSTAEEDRHLSPPRSPQSEAVTAAVDEAAVQDMDRKIKDLPQKRHDLVPPPKQRSPRKLSRWELPEPTEREVPIVSEPNSIARDAHEQDVKVTTEEAALPVDSSPSELPSTRPGVLAFVPRASKKPVASRATPRRPPPAGECHGTSFSSPQKALMAIAQASKAKREADLLERARVEQLAAAVKAEPEATEEEKLAVEVAKEQRQAEALQHLFWKSGGQYEGGKIDRLYSAAALDYRIALLARKVPAFCPSQELSAPPAPIYLALLSQPCRPARHRLPSLPAFPLRRSESSTIQDSHERKNRTGQPSEQTVQPDKRQLLALEYLYGRAVGVDECAHLEKHEPVTWRLVRVMAAVAEVNEWYRRTEQTADVRSRGVVKEAERDWKVDLRRM